MKKLVFLAVLSAFCFIGCNTVKEIPVKTETVYNYIDSIVMRDSVVTVPIERYVDIAKQYDTLKLSTSLASAEAWLDTSQCILKGSIWNNSTYTKETKYIDHYITRDSIAYKDIPVQYEVEKIVKEKPWTFYMYRIWFWVTIAAAACFIALKIYFKKL